MVITSNVLYQAFLSSMNLISGNGLHIKGHIFDDQSRRPNNLCQKAFIYNSEVIIWVFENQIAFVPIEFSSESHYIQLKGSTLGPVAFEPRQTVIWFMVLRKKWLSGINSFTSLAAHQISGVPRERGALHQGLPLQTKIH